jgi:glycosyltransferase involved in cell wall biosynthesis
VRKAVCTIISKNYLAAARVLMNSAALHAPDADRVVLLVDRVETFFEPARENFRLLLSEELSIPGSRWFHFRYTILELNTAVKPFLIEKLMAEGYESVVYLDPDIQIYSPLDEIWQGLETHNAVLTPHLDQPIEDDKYPSEIDILRTGAYNLGFIGLRKSPETLEFVRWWGRRMERFCVVDLAGGLFVDQKWMDLLPGLLEPVRVLRHPGYNVAYWNIHGRRVEGQAGACTVNGQPLKFFHFSGFHPRRPERFSKHQNRFDLQALSEAAQSVCAGYARALIAAGFDETSKWPYFFGTFEDGKPVVDTGRRVWWELPSLIKEVADPFSAAGGSRIREAWNEMIPDPAGLWSGYSRLGWWLFEARPEVRAVMPDPFGSDRLKVLHWLVDGIRLEWSLPEEYFAPIRASLKIFSKYPDGKLPAELQRQLSGGALWGLPAAARTIHGARNDLKRTYPDPAGRDRAPFLLWLLTFGRLEHHLSADTVKTLEREWRDALSSLAASQALMLRVKYALMRAATAWRSRQREAEQARAARGLEPRALLRKPAGKAGQLRGVNLVGYTLAEMGVGESVRSASRAARAAGLETALFAVEAHPAYRASDTSAGPLSSSLPFPITILHVNADQTPAVLTELGARLASTRHKIGFWAWELEDFPERWKGSFDQVDEIWTPSEFCRAAVAAVSPKPVLRIPHSVDPLPEASHSLEALGVPAAGFTVLFIFDAMSVVARKNPMAAVEAFRRAFAPGDDARLVLKVSHSEAAPAAMHELRASTGDSRVTLLDRVMDRDELNSLMQHSDCLLSLHRSEGFGLTMAEAMSAGKTVICTGYSGNMDFTLPGSALPVEYRLTPVGEGNEPYDAASMWAEPDVNHAAALLRQAFMNPSMRARLGEEARRRVLRELSPEAVGKMMRKRLEALHQRFHEES